MTQDRKELRKEQNRLEILAAAEHVFARNGFHLTTMDDVAEACGWSKGTLYIHFKNKEDLFFSVISEKLEKFAEALATALARCQNLEQTIAALVDAQFQFFLENKEFFQLALAEQGKVMQNSSTGMRESLISKQQQHVSMTSQALQKHLSPHSVITSNTLARSILGTINIHTLTWLLSPDSINLEALKLEIIHLFLNGVIPNE